MRRRHLLGGSIVVLALACSACSQAPATPGGGTPDRDALRELVDQRIAVALTARGAALVARRSEASLVDLVRSASGAAQAQPGPAAAGNESVVASVQDLAGRLDELSASVEQQLAGGGDLAALERQIQEAMQALQDTQQAYPDYDEYFVDEDSGGEPFLDRVGAGLDSLLGLMGRLQQARATLDEMRGNGEEQVVEYYGEYAEDYADWDTYDEGDTHGGGRVVASTLLTTGHKKLSGKLGGGNAASGPAGGGTVFRGNTAGQGDVLASTTFDSRPDVTIDVLRLERSTGDTVTLEFALTNGSDTDDLHLDSGRFFGQDMHHSWWLKGRVWLVDQDGQQSLHVVKPPNGQALSSVGRGGGDHLVKPGEQRVLWARYPTPQSPRVTIMIPDCRPIDGVPVSG